MYLKRVTAVIATLLALSTPPSASATRPVTHQFDLDSTRSTYPFVMRLQGTMELRGDSILVELKNGLVRSAIPPDLGEEGVARDIQIAFGLGETIENGWQMSHDTAAQVVAASLSPGEMRSLGPMHFVVTGISKVPSRDQWLAARLTVSQHLPGLPAGLLSSYACSEDNLLGATAASRERAKQMRATYSKTC